MDFTKRYRGQDLRCGYTTGSCATAAAKKAAYELLTGCSPEQISFVTPQGLTLELAPRVSEKSDVAVTCVVTKDSGDDPDITDGVDIFATVSRIPAGLVIDGGLGVGLVTKPGLDQPVGNKAINSGPRKMLSQALEEVRREAGYQGGLRVIISIPAGMELAKKTFNPRLGIEGGISVIGTTGIVEPMSNQALIDTIVLEIKQAASRSKQRINLISGNYSKQFLADDLHIQQGEVVVCSNFIGDALDAAWREGFQEVLLVGHIGKFVKLGLGMPNTHSDNGDGRIECLITCALKAGASRTTLLEVSECVTTDAALFILQDQGLLEASMQELGLAISRHLAKYIPTGRNLGFLFFTNKEGLPGELYRSKEAQAMLKK